MLVKKNFLLPSDINGNARVDNILVQSEYSTQINDGIYNFTRRFPKPFTPTPTHFTHIDFLLANPQHADTLGTILATLITTVILGRVIN
jgi:hypothetical protein